MVVAALFINLVSNQTNNRMIAILLYSCRLKIVDATHVFFGLLSFLCLNLAYYDS